MEWTVLRREESRRLPRMQWLDGGLLTSSRWLLLLFLVVGLVLPLMTIFWRAFTPDGMGGWTLFTEASFYQLMWQSIRVAATVALITLLLAYLFAYALQRTLIPAKSFWRGLSLLPLMAPSMLPAIALIYLFGNQGLFRDWVGANIYGFWGIVLGQVIYTFPHALMILLSALAVTDARLVDAAASMGASQWRSFRSITWPGSRQGTFAAFSLVFTLSITDFGVPVVVGGDYSVLALEAYKSVVGQQQFGRGAMIGLLLLLLPALLTFAIDAWLRRGQSLGLSARSRLHQPVANRRRDLSYLLLVSLIGAGFLIIFGMAIYSSFIQFWPYNLSFSLRHYQFAGLPGGWSVYENSLIMAFLSAVFGSVIVFASAWLVEKVPGSVMLNRCLRALAFIPMAVPGLVLGLGYVFFFNHPYNPLNGKRS